jgi:hypothetical protein
VSFGVRWWEEALGACATCEGAGGVHAQQRRVQTRGGVCVWVCWWTAPWACAVSWPPPAAARTTLVSPLAPLPSPQVRGPPCPPPAAQARPPAACVCVAMWQHGADARVCLRASWPLWQHAGYTHTHMAALQAV